MMKRAIFMLICMAALLTSCHKSPKGLTDVKGEPGKYSEADVNAIDQALPQIMIIPSDKQLQTYRSLKYANGVTERDYNRYLLENKDARSLFSVLQNEFVRLGYPLNDLEQTLRQLTNRSALDEADDLARDTKTMLLMTAAPDIILELDYRNNIDRQSYQKTTQYTLTFIDSYTGKVFSTKNVSGGEGATASEALSACLADQMDDITSEIRNYFSDILTRGREVSVRITVENGSPLKLTDRSIEGGTYSDWIRDYMNRNTVKGAYKMAVNTRNELSFNNVRIPLLRDDGTQYNAFDWARDFSNAISRNLGLRVENRSQGLGDVHLVIMGM